MTNNCDIIHYHGDITKLNIECIVYSNEKNLQPNTTNDSPYNSIYTEQELSEDINHMPVGLVKLTNGHNSKYIIYVIAPKAISEETEDHKLLSRCYFQSLELAKKNNISEIAYTCI